MIILTYGDYSKNPHRHSEQSEESPFSSTFIRIDPSDLRPQDDTER
jgi:hypothetical protein